MSGTDAPGDTDLARSRLYLLLGAVLARPPDETVLSVVRALEADPGAGTERLAGALAALASVAAETSPDNAAAAYQTLFIGVGRGELVPYASWYRTGFVGEWPLARIREDMASLGIACVDGSKEPDDHVAALCEMMSGLATGTFGTAADHAVQAAFFKAHIGPWAQRFFEDLAATKTSAFYAAVGELGARFLEVEEDFLLGQPAASP